MPAILFVLAFLCELVDSTLGMGYGTALTPILLCMGYSPTQIIPAVLLSEFVTGLAAAFCHHKKGNVKFSWRSRALRVAFVLGLCSIVGTVSAVFLAVSLSKFALKLYIGILVLAMGIIILAARHRKIKFSWKRIVGLGMVASFNKGMSGGGYGPVVCGGQLLSGVESKGAIAITSLAEGLTCLVGLICFAALGMFPGPELACPLMMGAVLSTPLSAAAVDRLGNRRLVVLVGLVTVGLGLLTITRVLL